MKMSDIYGDRSPGSTIDASEMDDHMQSSPVRAGPKPKEQNPTDSLFMALGAPVSENGAFGASTEDDEPDEPGVAKQATKKSGSKSSRSKARGDQPHAALNASIYTGNKVKHLKKDDGEPLWRKDIQYDFLKAIFESKLEVFTNSYEPESPKQTFADLYIDAMARSSKTSKILRDKLLSEHEPAKNMAMVCLLVNLGRMNTTLNCMLY